MWLLWIDKPYLLNATILLDKKYVSNGFEFFLTTRVRPQIWVLDNKIILNVWQTVTLYPFDLQTLTAPLLKILNWILT